MIEENAITESEGHRIGHTPKWMSLGMTAQKRESRKGFNFLFDLRFSWDSAVMLDL